MSSRLSALLLTAAISVIGPVYHQLPPQVQQMVPAEVRAQIVRPGPGAGPGAAPVSMNVQAELDRLVADVTARHGGRATVSVAGAGVQFTAGDNRPDYAFSSMKVPLAIAALRQSPAFYRDAELAVTASDNPAAHRMFAVVPTEAYARVIAEAGSGTSGSAAYQMHTAWTTSDMARFASGLRCVAGHEPVLDMMGRVVDYQRWGLGRIPGARFKGGWNYYQDGHMARQFGLIPGPNGDIAVAITAWNPRGHTGSYAMLNDMADGLRGMSAGLPRSRC